MWPLMTFTVCPDGVKFPLNTGEHFSSVHLNTTAPNNTQTRHYTLPQPPSINPNSMIIYCSKTQRGHLHLALGGRCFYLFPQFVMRLFVAKGTFEWDMAPVDLEERKVWMQRFFPAIFQLEESCVECSRQQERERGFLTFLLQHNNPY